MDLNSKLVYAFNTFFADFIKYVKTVDPGLKKRLKKKYRVVDKSNKAILDLFCCQAASSGAYALIADTTSPDPCLTNEEFLKMTVFTSISVGDILEKCNEEGKNRVVSHVAAMCGVSHLYSELNSPVSQEEEKLKDSEIDSMFSSLMETLENPGEPKESAMDNVLDDEILGLFKGIVARTKRAYNTDWCRKTGIEDILKDIKSSRLGEIAEEVSKTINKDELKKAFEDGKGMEDIVRGLMTGENVGMIGSLVQQVGDKINSKIKSGDMKEEDLLRDAFNIMGKMKSFGK
jgi:hypothetical protein